MELKNNSKRLRRLSFLALLAMPFISMAQWTEVIPGTGSSGMEQIDCIGNTCFIGGGNNDLVMKSTDGGVNWTDVGIVASMGTGYMKMFDLDTVYVVRGGSLFRTYNGGTNWEEVPIIYAIGSFANPSVGFAIDGSYNLYKTIDKGNNWTLLNTIPNQVQQIGKIYFSNEQVGFIGATETDRYSIYKTINGGQTWNKVFEKISTTSPITNIEMVTSNVGYACGGTTEGLILKTIDGGNSWTELANPFQNVAGYTSLHFINTNSGYVVGGSTRIVKTIDGGANWTDESYASGGFLKDVEILDLQTVYIASYSTSGSALLKNSSAGLVVSIFENGKTIGKIYPNPTADKIQVEIEKQNCNFKLLDPSGKVLFDAKLTNGQNSTFDLSNYQAGFFLYQIYDNTGVLGTGKLTKN